jgi:hypothetical protein
MGTGAETQEETKGGASQSRDVIPELLLLIFTREPIDSNSKAIATRTGRGASFFQFLNQIFGISSI